MISGRYVTDHRARHWSSSNPDGHCQLCLLTRHHATPGTLEHQLLKCPVLHDTRSKSISHWSQYLIDKPSLLPIVRHHTLTPGPEGVKLQMELLLDPSTCPMVVQAVQVSGNGILTHLFYLTRTWCHSNHLKRRKMLKLYNIIWNSLCSDTTAELSYFPSMTTTITQRVFIYFVRYIYFDSVEFLL